MIICSGSSEQSLHQNEDVAVDDWESAGFVILDSRTATGPNRSSECTGSAYRIWWRKHRKRWASPVCAKIGLESRLTALHRKRVGSFVPIKKRRSWNIYGRFAND